MEYFKELREGARVHFEVVKDTAPFVFGLGKILYKIERVENEFFNQPFYKLIYRDEPFDDVKIEPFETLGEIFEKLEKATG